MLVTGVSGFVGGHLAAALASAGARVQGVGIGSPRPGLPLERWHEADLRDPAALARAIAEARPAAVVHLAGQSSAGASFEQPVETFRINALGTWHLLQAVSRATPRARVLAIGSGEAYGPQPPGTRVREDAPARPVSPYALSKAAADAYARAAFEHQRLDVVRTRSFAHAGPGQDARFALPSWARQIAAAEAHRAEPVLRVGNLEITRDITDVRDVARAYRLLLERGRPGAVYNVCSGRGVKLTEVVGWLVAQARVPVRVEPDPARVRSSDVTYLVGDPAMLEAETGWRPEIGLETTLRDVLDGARAGPG